MSCFPKIFVYKLPSFLQDATNSDVKKAFGHMKNNTSSYYNTNQYALSIIMLNRIYKSSCYTKNASNANIFYIPILAKPKSLNEWKHVCKGLKNIMLEKYLPHLTVYTAQRHFFTLGKGHYAMKDCPFWYNPQGLLTYAVRLSYSHSMSNINTEKNEYANFVVNTDGTYPNLYSVPYPSSIHWHGYEKKDPIPYHKRIYFMSFIGNLDHGDIQVRSMIKKQCRKYNNNDMCYINSNDILLKQKSIFCLEPGGDSPFRKSLSDSLALNCIPVIFSKYTDAVAPLFWGKWRDSARVLIPRTLFIKGKIDLYTHLKQYSGKIRKMQETISRNKRSFQYSLGNDNEDAVSVILNNVASN